MANKFKGLLIKESLSDLEILKSVSITKKEKWNSSNSNEFQPKIWTAVYFEGEDIEKFAKRVSKSIKNKGWYLNLSVDDLEYVIFHNKIFKYKKGNKEAKQEAVEYGKNVGVPEKQLDW
ncbi:MAG: hypothetical protein WD876_03890 [Candidatus Pacearchaeota archaeon]